MPLVTLYYEVAVEKPVAVTMRVIAATEGFGAQAQHGRSVLIFISVRVFSKRDVQPGEIPHGFAHQLLDTFWCDSHFSKWWHVLPHCTSSRSFLGS